MLSLRTQNLIDVLDVLLMVTMISFCSFIQCTSNVHIIGSIYLVRTLDVTWFFNSNIGSAGLQNCSLYCCWGAFEVWYDALPGTTSIRLELNSPAPHSLHHDRFLLFSLQHGPHNWFYYLQLCRWIILHFRQKTRRVRLLWWKNQVSWISHKVTN